MIIWALRNVDALSPLRFHLVVDALTIFMNNEKETGLIKGVLSEYTKNDVNMIQFVDDTIFLLQDDFESAHNLKFIL